MRFTLITLICFVLLPASAQLPQKFLTVGVTPLSYKGDLNHSYKKWSAGFATSLLFNRAKRVNSEFNFIYGSVWGSDPNYETLGITNNYFKSKFFVVNYALRINILSKENYKIYLSPGLGFFRFNPKNQDGESLKDDFSTREEDEEYSNISLSLPLKMGGMYLLRNGIGLSYEFGWLNPTTDYLDNISALGNRERNDNVLFHKFSILIPLKTKED